MPAPVLVATVGSNEANSYATVAECSAYLNERLNTGAWDTAVDAEDGDPERALIQATRLLDKERFQGVPVKAMNGTVASGDTQALKWPRYSATNDAGWTWESTVIPQIVKDATCEMALWLLNQADSDPTQPTGLEGFQNVAVGSLNVTPRHDYAPDDFPSHVRRILAPVLTGGRNTVRLTRS